LQTAFTSLNGETLTQAEVLAFTLDLLDNWSSTSPAAPPPFASNDGQYLSLCDMTQCLVGMLAGYGTSLPSTVALGRAIGPLTATLPSLMPPTVAPGDLLAAAAALDPLLNSTTWAKTPDYTVPSYVTVGTSQVNAAEFLYLCAKLFVDLAQGNSPPSVLAPASTMLDPAIETAEDQVSSLADKWPYLNWDIKPAILSGFAARLSVNAPPQAGSTLTVHLTDDVGSQAYLCATSSRPRSPLSAAGGLQLDPRGAHAFPRLSLGQACTGSWEIPIPASYRGPLYLQALCENRGRLELTQVLSLEIP
jgi:hypothetical protein